MKYFRQFVAIAGLIIIFWPWGFVVVDIASFVITGEQATSFPWSGDSGLRGLCAAFWPLLAMLVILGSKEIAGIFEP